MAEIKIPSSNVGQPNIDNIEEYLKNKYKFLTEKSPYTQSDFFQKVEEKALIQTQVQEKNNSQPKKSQDDTLDITIFRDIQLNGRDPDNLLKKYENITKDDVPTNQKANNPNINSGGLTSDPKLNKLLSDVENIVQKATGKFINNDPTSTSEPKFMNGNKMGLSNKRNADIENQEIRAYLKNLDSKLNIIVPKKNSEEKENPKYKDKVRNDNKNKRIKNKRESSCSSTSETSPSFKQEPKKREPNSTAFMNNKNSVCRDDKKPVDKNPESNRASCSPTKTCYSRVGRTSTRHIFDKFNCAENKVKEYADIDKNFNHQSNLPKTTFEMETNIFCVNCEEFISENKIDEHSRQCHKSTNHRVPSVDNHYNSLTSSNDKNNAKTSNIYEIKKVNEQLNKITIILLQKIKYFENMSMTYMDPSNSQQTMLMLSRFLELTLNLIHNKDASIISIISKNLHEIFINLSEMSNVSPDILQILQKIKQFCKIKYEILDPNNNYYNAISSNKNCSYNPMSHPRYSAMPNFNNISSYISDNMSSINGISKTKPFADMMGSPSQKSNCSELTNTNSKILKKKFFKLAISMKLALPKGHPGHQVNLSDLFFELLQMKLSENEWEEYLEHKLNVKS